MESNRCEFPGYQVLDPIHETVETVVYKAIRTQDRCPVILKMLKPAHATLIGLSRYRHEYETMRNLNAANVIKVYGLESYEQTLFLVLEDFGGTPLNQWISKWQRAGTDALPIPGFLTLAIHIADGLAEIHVGGVIHKNLTPVNLMFNPATGEIRIVNFEIATTLSREIPSLKNPRGLEGNLAYLSPEQTGRMNRAVDYRTDFYSLGVTFYELLTGRLPFEATDAMELVHAHLAKTPVAPRVLNPAIPDALSNLVLKLMAKAPEDRYQSTRGLKQDLNLCLQRWQIHGKISPFELGREDRADHFLIPEKLYGRTAEVTSILAAFERTVHGRAELMLVAGFPGIGKTAVVHEVHKPIAREHGYFIQGKFDQLKRDIPFSAFVEALRDLMGQLLSEGEVQREQWKSKILNALGDNAQVIIEVIPELERIVGPQLAVPDLSGNAAQNRFHLLFHKFIAIFTTQDHPLVIFLDDLQWADSASLTLMQRLISATRMSCLLLIGAYRDNEVTPVHPLRLTLAEIEISGASLNTITLAPLNASDINQLIADALSCSLKMAYPLTELVYRITQGNPFFNNQFLKSLYEEGLIAFNHETGSWQCDLAQVNALNLTDDVVDFLAIRLRKLPAYTQEILKLAACIGNSFDLGTLAIVCQRSQVDTAANLWASLQAGLVLPQSAVFKFYQGSGHDAHNPFDAGSQVPAYRFLHDRVQQAAYSLIPAERKKLTHLHIARLLLRNTPEKDREEKIFEIVNHFNRGLDLLTEPAERQELAQLNLKAGQKAKAATAFQAAWDYFTIARPLLPEDCWRCRYDFTLNLYESSVEAAYLSGHFEAMEELANVVLKEARTLLDQVKVFEVKSQALAAQTKLLEAVNTGLQVLTLLGVTFPQKPNQIDVHKALQETQSAYREKGIAALIDLPLMTDPTQLAAMRILASILPTAFLSIPELYTLLVLKQVELSVKYGNTPASAFCYASYGLVLCGKVGDIESGYQFGQLALDLVCRLDAKEWHCKVTSVVHTFTTHWKRSVGDTLIPLRSAYYCGLEVGDFQFAGYSAILYSAYAYFTGIGKGLSELQQETLSLRESISQMKQTTVLQYFHMLLQALHDLREGRTSSKYLAGEYYDEETMLSRHLRANDRMGVFYVYFHKLMLNYLMGEHRQAVEDAGGVEQFLDAATGFPYIPIFYFYDSLARLAANRESPQARPEELLLRIEASQEKLKTWAHYAPMNCLHKYQLVEAERLRTFGDKGKAIEEYDRAIAGAKENGYLREEALANELAATFFLDWGKEKVAQAYMKEAYEGYTRWGANAKAAQLKQRYSRLLAPLLSTQNRATGQAGGSATDRGGTTTTTVGASLDLATVVKASQAISGEIDLARLLTQLMHIVIENAGAQRGALILERDGEWVIEAQEDVNQGDISVLEGRDLRTSGVVSAEIVSHVVRTRASVLLDDAAGTGDFFRDPHIEQDRVKSVICAPLINQGRLSGIVYLENNSATHAFTAERLELLNLLSAQMALSLDNARLYQKAQQEIAERKQAEAALRESERRFRTIFDSVNDAIFVHDITTGNILDVNRTTCAMYGYTREELLGRKVEDVSHGKPPYTQHDALTWMEKAAEEGPQLFEWRAKHKDGHLFWVEVNMRRAVLNSRDRILVAARDITARKGVEAALQRSESVLRATMESIHDGLLVVSETGKISHYNSRFLEIWSIPTELMSSGSDQVLLDYVAPQLVEEEQFLAGVNEIYRTNTKNEDMLHFKDGRILERFYYPLSHVSEKAGRVWLFRDITGRKRAEAELARHRDRLEELVRERTAELEKEIAERKQTEQRIQTALAEKEVLLREVHHRVKNNLNTIANMLYFQAKTLEDPRALAAFQDSQSRIQSMARVHEHLYRSTSLAQINMAAYFEDLTVDLRQTCGRSDVTVQIDAAKEHLDIDQAIPCGLIVNELVTNSLKYAFREGTANQGNEVTVQLTTQAEQHMLEVRDNGVGLPAGMAVENNASLGLRLVSMLTRQLKARLTVDTAAGKGTRFAIVFPLETKGTS